MTHALNLVHVLSHGSSRKGHSESLGISDHLCPSLYGRDQMGRNPFKGRNPVQILARVIFVSWFLSASYFDIFQSFLVFFAQKRKVGGGAGVGIGAH